MYNSSTERSHIYCVDACHESCESLVRFYLASTCHRRRRFRPQQTVDSLYAFHRLSDK